MQRTFEAGRLDDLPRCLPDHPLSRGSATCNGCHFVELQCDACHSRHLFSAEQSRKPAACGTCHMGPDHAQYGMYTSSKHGVLYAARGDRVGPSCVSCHMGVKRTNPDGGRYTDHDLAHGIAFGPVGGRPRHVSFKRGGQLPDVLQGTGEGATIAPNPAYNPAAPYDMRGADDAGDSEFACPPGVTTDPLCDRDGVIDQVVDSDAVLQARRREMLATCDRCHARSFATDTLLVADQLHLNADSVTGEAADILRALSFDELIDPAVARRDPNPDGPPGLVLGGPMLYRNLSAVERYYFKMYKYDNVKTWHGAYHNNPDYAHWYGWAELNMSLAAIGDEATKVRRDHALDYALRNGLTGSAVWRVPYQGVIYRVGSMEKTYVLFKPDAGGLIDSFGSGTPRNYTGLTFQ